MRFFLILIVALTIVAPFSYAQNLAEQPMPIQNLALPEEPDADLFEIPDAYFREARLYMKYCEVELKMRRHYDCECLAAKFLDERITVGPDVPRARIAETLTDQCQDASEAASGQYTSCLGNSLLLPSGIDPMVYCTCYANEFAKIFEVNKLVVGPTVMTKVQSRAHLNCRKTGFAEAQYGDRVPALPPIQ